MRDLYFNSAHTTLEWYRIPYSCLLATIAVFAPNYTGPDDSCLPASSITIRGVEFKWTAHDTVGALSRDIESELGLPVASLWFESMKSRGTRHSARNSMDVIAREGFIVHVGAQSIEFQRPRQQ